MSFADIKSEFRNIYKIPEQNFVKEFLLPVLSETRIYKRSAGYFSSYSLLEIATGLVDLRNGGKVKIITSPNLSKEDVEAIELGYKNRDAIIKERIIDVINPKDECDRECLNLLANLITDGTLDIKIAFSKKEEYLGLYHEKSGIMIDELGNKIAFTGSANESKDGYFNNYEKFYVFENDKNMIEEMEESFDNLWDDNEVGAKVIDFTEALKQEMIKYRKDSVNVELIKQKYFESNVSTSVAINIPENYPTLPEPDILRDYQVKAIEEWTNNKYRGIFDMATGTGKTFTALGAITFLARRIIAANQKLIVLIVCPYQHLVEQWVEDLVKFNIDPIVGYSAVKYKDRLKNEIECINYDIKNFMCFITTNASFRTTEIQQILKNIETNNILLCVDEAHNFGSEGLRKTLDERYRFRLALSATLERHRDEEGTNALCDYFGEKCIEYSLKMAIQNDVLTRYYYYPICVSLNDEEREKYRELTDKIRKLMQNKDNIENEELLEMLLIKRARIIAGAENKLTVLKEELEKHRGEYNILIYCGAAKSPNIEYDDSGEDIRQINSVLQILDKEIGMIASKFTSEESSSERSLIIESFKNKVLNAIVAIKCLDEGVNIPSIEKAFILASSTNPKEYIQRRGRVLRKSEGKKYSYIYDFITLPFDIEQTMRFGEGSMDLYAGMVRNEVIRMKDFASLAENSYDCEELIYDLERIFNLNLKGEESWK